MGRNSQGYAAGQQRWGELTPVSRQRPPVAESVQPARSIARFALDSAPISYEVCSYALAEGAGL